MPDCASKPLCGIPISLSLSSISLIDFLWTRQSVCPAILGSDAFAADMKKRKEGLWLLLNRGGGSGQPIHILMLSDGSHRHEAFSWALGYLMPG